MPHQRGDPALPFGARGVPPSIVRDGRESLPPQVHNHVVDFQRRSMGPRMIHHSPASQHGMMQARQAHPSMFRGPYPHSPASWSYASAHNSPPHRVPAGLSAASSAEHFMEEHTPKSQQSAVSPERVLDAAMREKADIINEALKRHMDDDRSIGTNEADAASALLFATTVVRHEESSKVSVAEEPKPENQESKDMKQSGAAEEAGENNSKDNKKDDVYESNIPLKKRRKLLEILRKEDVTSEKDPKHPLHVSPLPSPAGHSHTQHHESTEETEDSVSPQRTAGTSSTCLESSYGLKDAQGLHSDAKIGNTLEITQPPSQVVIEHFPMVLHNVLTKSEFAGNVVQWVSDGKAWKIVRWDALRRTVLPKYFSKLQDEDGNVGSSIDSFLYHVTSWGFEEVQDGPDVGAYAHELFQKESPELCRQMTFAPKQNELESPTTAPPAKTASTVSDKLNEASQRRHSILQVPSLASSVRSVDGDSHSKAAEKAMQWREEAELKKRAIHSPTITYPMAGRPMHHPETPVYMGYRMNEMAYASEGFHFYPESPHGMRHLGSPGGLGVYDRRFLTQRGFEFSGPRTIALHNSPRLQSVRGRLLSPAVRTGVMEQPQRRPSFPVSNRGKGARGAAACRVPGPSSDSSQASTSKQQPPIEQHQPEESMGLQRFSEKVAERVSVAVSRKTKRKLPISMGKASSEASPEHKNNTKVEVTGKEDKLEEETDKVEEKEEQEEVTHVANV